MYIHAVVEEVEHRAVRPGRKLQIHQSIRNDTYNFMIYISRGPGMYCKEYLNILYVLLSYITIISYCASLLPSSGVRAADAVAEDVEERTTLIMCICGGGGSRGAYDPDNVHVIHLIHIKMCNIMCMIYNVYDIHLIMCMIYTRKTYQIHIVMCSV
jgi:hypothetical protein